MIAAAVNVNVLDITGCNPNPLVIEVGHGEAIEVINRGPTDHVLRYGEDTLTIPAGGSRGLVPSRFGVRGDSDGGEGFAGYGCDDSNGIFHIISDKLQKHIYFQVVQFLFPNGESGPGIKGVTVTLWSVPLKEKRKHWPMGSFPSAVTCR